MNKRLPNIYKGRITKNLNQNEAIIDRKIKEEINERKELSFSSVTKQIKDIFNSPSFIYKADTLITLKNGEKIKKTIIGKNNNSLISMDDDLIDISSIEKIEKI